jgi:hypothetical protein
LATKIEALIDKQKRLNRFGSPIFVLISLGSLSYGLLRPLSVMFAPQITPHQWQQLVMLAKM